VYNPTATPQAFAAAPELSAENGCRIRQFHAMKARQPG
jgi:hypothetical protein